MFTETDEIFVWAKKGRKNKVYKLKTSASVKQLFIELFNNGINSLMQDDNGDEREPKRLLRNTEHRHYDSGWRCADNHTGGNG